MPAMDASEEFPEFLKGANITHNEDGSWSIKTDWGVSTGFPGASYLKIQYFSLFKALFHFTASTIFRRIRKSSSFSLYQVNALISII